jgi:CBS domain containing-hemolysin-like protein
MDPLPCWVAVAIATVATTYLSLLLGALREYSLARFEDLLEGQPERMGRLRELLAHEDRLVTTLNATRGLFLVGGLVALTGGLIAEAVRGAPLAEIGPWGWVAVGLEAASLGAALFVVLGKVMPSAVGERRAERVLNASLPALEVAQRLLAPLAWLFNGVATITLRVANVREVEKEEELKDEILSAALAGENQGVLDEAAMDVIENLMEFRDVEVTEVMTPRIDVDYVDADMDFRAMVETVRATGRSRLPVTDGGSVDKIVGVLMAKDLLTAPEEDPPEPSSLFRKAFFVPETKRVADLLKELRQRRLHLALVADEYGGTAGLVTIEDLIEELIGEIDDEHDKHAVPVRRLSESELDVDGKVHLDQLNEDFGTKLPEDEDVETVGGFLALKLGRIPAKGDTVTLNGTSLTVTEADERRVERVHVRLNKAS